MLQAGTANLGPSSVLSIEALALLFGLHEAIKLGY